MIPGMLNAASRKRGFRAPSGKFYPWTKETPPTQADIDALIEWDKKYAQKPRVVITSKEGPMKDAPRVKKTIARRPSLLDSLDQAGRQVTEAEREARGTGFKTVTSNTGASPAERKVADAKVAAQTTQASAKEIRDNVNKATEAVAAKMRPYMPDLAAELLSGAIMVPANTLAEADTILSVSGGASAEERARAAANLILQWVPLGAVARYGVRAGVAGYKGGTRVGAATVAGIKGGVEAAQKGEPIIRGATRSAAANDAIRTSLKSGVQDVRSVRGGETPRVAAKVKETVAERAFDVAQETLQEQDVPPRGLADQLRETLDKTRRGEFNEFVPPNKYEQAAEAKAQQAAKEFNEGLESMTQVDDLTAAKNANTKQAREQMGLEELPPAERQTFEGWLGEAEDIDLNRTIDRIEETGGTMSGPETAAATLRLARLKADHKRILSELTGLTDEADIAARNIDLRSIESEFDRLTKAVKNAGSDAGRALVSRKLTLNEDLELVSVLGRAKAKKGADLTPAERTTLERITKEYEAAQVRIRDLEDAIAMDTFTPPTKAIRKRKTTAQLDLERDEAVKALKEALIKTTAKASSGVDIEGVSDIAKAIAKLAQNYIERGFLKLEDVVGKIKEDFPELTDRQIRDAISGYGKTKAPRTVKEATRLRNELVKEARLLSQIEDAISGTYKPGRRLPLPSPKIKALRAQLDALLKEHNIRGNRDAAERLRRLKETLDQVKNRSATAKKKTVDPPEIKAVKEELRRARQKINYEDQIADLTKQLESGELKVREKRVAPKVKELEDLKYKRDKLRDEVDLKLKAMEPKTTGDKVKGVIADAFNTPRTLLSTGDFSGFLRQMVWFVPRNPLRSIRALGKGAQAAFSEKAAYRMMREIKEDPLYQLADQSGVYIADLPGQLGKHEEAFLASAIQKIPVLGQVFKGSERNMVTMLNTMRFELFKEFAKHNMGDATALKAYAKYVNAGTGRGSLGNFERAAGDLATAVFSPRLLASRFQTPLYAAHGGGSGAVRAEAIKDLVAFISAGGAILGIAKMNGAESTIDPDDPDFGKIVVGDTRFDIWGGFQQPARAIARLLKGVVESAQGDPNVDPWDIATRYLEYKASPGVSNIRTMFTQEDVMGNEMTIADFIERNTVPLSVQEMMETAEQEGWLSPKTAAVGAGSFLGVGASTYKK